jgi:hypothetical protein
VYLDSKSSLLYIGDSRLLAVCLGLMSLYVLICNCSIIDCIFDFLGEVCKITCLTRGFNILYSWVFNVVVQTITIVVNVRFGPYQL